MPRSNNKSNTNLINGALELESIGDQCELVDAEAVEGVSELFAFTCRISLPVSTDFTIGNRLGETGTFFLVEGQEDQRCFHGVLTGGRFLNRGERGGQERNFYELTFRPRLYLFSKNRDYRIYQDMSVPDIIAQVLGRCGVLFRKSLTQTYDPRGYCVQYGESDYDFVSRLMEEEGIYFFFEHTQSSHTLAMFDALSAHPMTKGISTIPFLQNTRSGSMLQDLAAPCIDKWAEYISTEGQKTFTVHDNLFAMNGNSFEGKTNVPAEDFFTKSKANLAEVYEFEGTYEYEQPAGGAEDASVGQKHGPAMQLTSKLYSEAAKAPRQYIHFHTNVLSLNNGTKFTLTEHPGSGNVNGDYLITRLRAVVITGGAKPFNDDGERKDGIFAECIFASRQWRTPLRTRRPIVHGPETAIVTGPAGEEIFTDKYGRVKVQFHWDRQGKMDGQSSCWLRVSQTGGLGNIILPRIGHEVLVAFMGGNPDRPIIVGRVFNSETENMPHYALPDNKTIATWRSKSYKTKKGETKTGQKLLSESTFESVKEAKFDDLKLNELRFEDKTAAEEVMLYAQLDMKTFIRSDEEHLAGRNQKTWIGNDSERTVENDSKITINGNETREIKGTNTVTVTKDQTVKLLANVDTQTTGTNKIKVTGENTETYQNKSTIDVLNAYSLESKGADIHLKALTKIVLECGPSKLEMSPQGITITGVMFKAEGSTTATVKGSVVATLEGGMTVNVKGGVAAVVQAGIVKLN